MTVHWCGIHFLCRRGGGEVRAADIRQAGDAEPAHPGPDLRQVLLLLLPRARDRAQAGLGARAAARQAQDRHPQERLRGPGGADQLPAEELPALQSLQPGDNPVNYLWI